MIQIINTLKTLKIRCKRYRMTTMTSCRAKESFWSPSLSTIRKRNFLLRQKMKRAKRRRTKTSSSFRWLIIATHQLKKTDLCRKMLVWLTPNRSESVLKNQSKLLKTVLLSLKSPKDSTIYNFRRSRRNSSSLTKESNTSHRSAPNSKQVMAIKTP